MRKERSRPNRDTVPVRITRIVTIRRIIPIRIIAVVIRVRNAPAPGGVQPQEMLQPKRDTNPSSTDNQIHRWR